MGRITVIGTGWSAGQLTLDAIDALTGGGRILLHTDRCGCAAWLRERHLEFASLDALYEECEDFDEHASAAARAVLDAAAREDVVYAVADVRDRSVSALCAACLEGVRVIAGPPVEGSLMALVTGEMRCVEASDWEAFHLSAHENCLVRELDGRELAGEVKLKLMEVYPEESEIWMLQGDADPVRLPLYTMDRGDRFDHRTCVLVPAQQDIMKQERYDFSHLMEIIGFLCSPNGCPWDRVQTHESLRPCILEEAYEVIDAIDEGDVEHLYDELGDMLLQVALHAEIGRRHGEFDISDVTTAICEKMISRHTHVFGRDQAENAEEVLGLWSKNKMAERGQRTHAESMRDITRSLPATLRAAKLFKRAAEAGLGDADAGEAFARVVDQIRVLEVSGDATEAALGDLLLTLCGYARLKGVDPELALNGASDRFIARFEKIEGEILENGRTLASLPSKTLREYWDLVKL